MNNPTTGICRHYCITGKHTWEHKWFLPDMPKCAPQDKHLDCSMHGFTQSDLI